MWEGKNWVRRLLSRNSVQGESPPSAPIVILALLGLLIQSMQLARSRCQQLERSPPSYVAPTNRLLNGGVTGNPLESPFSDSGNAGATNRRLNGGVTGDPFSESPFSDSGNAGEK
ncbi:hypothetical protein R1flu_001799 [Riccia fluitans]|uniref:Uncharacterized protein n=1 Tax=Riccia fluitans TaxID=41844 RepID=A0ABD1Y5D5_9MARC